MRNLMLFFENYAHKIAYLFNVINSHFIIVAVLGVIILSLIQKNISFIKNPLLILIYIIFLYFLFKSINFFPYFLLSTPFLIFLFYKLKNFNSSIALTLLLINIGLFYFSQIFNYYIPYLIASRGKIKIPFKIILNSIIMIAPTNSSLIICLFFSTVLAYFIYFQPNPIKDLYATSLLGVIIFSTILTKKFIPKSYQSKTFLPKNFKKLTKRIIYLNIDGTRLDKFEETELSFLNKLKKQGSYFKNGARSVYPALTNPAFMSILTGTIPEEHKVMNNNFKRKFKSEALQDIIKTSNYGNIHFEDISKKNWDTNLFPVAKYGFKIDDELFKKLKEDLTKKDSELFIVDISLVDMIGHGYGSYTKEYLNSLNIIDKKIEDLFNFLKKNKLLNNTTFIISSDHGHAIFDHGYGLLKSEMEVPLILYGRGIKRKILKFIPSIIDITPTICYLLGKRYPNKANGKVLIECIKV